ncbi:Suppression of tumorigenicity 5 [Balamuthia mandrillaris]
MSKGATPAKKLFDYIVLVCLEQKDGPTGAVTPVVRWRFPAAPSGQSKNAKDPFIENITKFCFPDISSYPKAKIKKTLENFSFVLTESDGEKRWGYCRRVLEPGDGIRFPQCFCVLSFFPCFAIFSEILDEMQKRGSNMVNLDSCSIFLNAIYQQPVPAPGGTIHVSTASLAVPGKRDEFTFTRPNDSESLFAHVNFEPLLNHLDPQTILHTFAALLVERRIIFIADTLGSLSACVQAIVALLYPFTWQHIFIPVLPQSLLTFCCAPMPFVVGVLRSCQPELEKLSGAMDEVIYVDLDNNKFISSFSEDWKLLPSSCREPLLEALSVACKHVKTQRSLRSRLLFGGKKGSDAASTSSPSLSSSPAPSTSPQLSAFSTSSSALNPPKRGSKIKLRRAAKRSDASLFNVQDLANAFIAFFVDMTHDYRRFIKEAPSTEDGIGMDARRGASVVFDSEGFLCIQTADRKQFLSQFLHSQMFEMFVQERARLKLNSGEFEKRVTMYIQSNSSINNHLLSSASGGNAACGSGNGPGAHSRFTMYERGEISREDITKSVNAMLAEEELKKQQAASPGNSSVIVTTNWVSNDNALPVWCAAPVIKQSMMLKMGGSLARKVWQPRWIVLTEKKLGYFKNKADRQPAGSMELKEIESITFIEYHPTLKKANCLEVRVPTRTYFLSVDPKEEAEAWHQAIARQIAAATLVFSPPSSSSSATTTTTNRSVGVSFGGAAPDLRHRSGSALLRAPPRAGLSPTTFSSSYATISTTVIAKPHTPAAKPLPPSPPSPPSASFSPPSPPSSGTASTFGFPPPLAEQQSTQSYSQLPTPLPPKPFGAQSQSMSSLDSLLTPSSPTLTRAASNRQPSAQTPPAARKPQWTTMRTLPPPSRKERPPLPSFSSASHSFTSPSLSSSSASTTTNQPANLYSSGPTELPARKVATVRERPAKALPPLASTFATNYSQPQQQPRPLPCIPDSSSSSSSSTPTPPQSTRRGSGNNNGMRRPAFDLSQKGPPPPPPSRTAPPSSPALAANNNNNRPLPPPRPPPLAFQ